ncbi:aldo/keto reductase [Pengzhenrongella phosphoraccumulans]|uniref:aldo/keto reductase n=1 Tax=Pengzhenrongella phosphoraccumulans TaxID=3114394 RepID=UPI00388FCE82
MSTTLPTRRIGPFEVSALGLGCMELSHAYGVPPSPDEGSRLLLAALDRGVTFFDTAALYGGGRNEELLGAALSGHRDELVLASKCGMQIVDGRKSIDGRPEVLKATCDAALRRLRTDRIDLYYLHRWDRSVPVEESVGALAELEQAGKIRAIGLSEVSVSTLRRAQSVHAIAAVQNEYSLWTRNPELGLSEACRADGVALVPFSPLARGFLTGALRDVSTLAITDIRRAMPRFGEESWPANVALLDGYRALANEAGCTPAQLGLAWLLTRGDHVVPIPGTTDRGHLAENLGALDVVLAPDILRRADALINQKTVCGPRYNADQSAEVDSDTFPDPPEAVA